MSQHLLAENGALVLSCALLVGSRASGSAGATCSEDFRNNPSHVLPRKESSWRGQQEEHFLERTFPGVVLISFHPAWTASGGFSILSQQCPKLLLEEPCTLGMLIEASSNI